MSSFRRLWGYARRYRGLILLTILSYLLMALFTVVSLPAFIPFLDLLFGTEVTFEEPPKLSYAQITDYLQYQMSRLIGLHGRSTVIAWVCIAIVFLFFFKNLFRYLAGFFMAPVRMGIIRDLRQALFNKMLELPVGYFSEKRKGDLISRSSSDVLEVEHSILNMVQIFFREPIIIIGCVAYMVTLNLQLMLFVFLLIGFTGIIIGGIGKRLRRGSKQAQTWLGDLISTLEEALGGMRIIKGFGAEHYQSTIFDRGNDRYFRLSTALLRQRDLASPLSEFLGVSVVALLLWYGSKLVFQEDSISASEFSTFLIAFFFIIDPAKKFSAAISNIQKGLAALDRIEEVLFIRSDIQEPEHPQPLGAFQHSIQYESVYFRYPGVENWVLENIQLTIPKGKTVALVGSSGAGKSTLADLLPRFYDVQRGQIRIDGIDIRDLSFQELRRQFGIVSQEAILFNDTIANNIRFGMQEVGAAQIEEAARIANAHDFILQTEQGYDTVIGERGTKLSGGQRQRLTIARAILRNPPILILDEATSALDSESEKLVQEALLKIMEGRTAIVIAHRLSTIQHADEIIVMQEGRIVERGNHQELIAHHGAYSKLVELQAF